jgi:cytosine/creatinine deaminase
MMAAPVVLRNPPMNVPPTPPFGSPAGSRSLAHATGAAAPMAPVYRIIDTRVPVDLAPALADQSAPDRFAACEIIVEGARISLLAPPGTAPAAADLPTIDLRGGIVLPRFVDVHTHIDKGHIWPRRANPDGTHSGARAAVAADREAHWSANDVRTRMDFSLRCAFAHGSGAIRTHLDSLGKQAAISWPVFAEMREQWRDRIALEAVALFPVDLAVDDEAAFRAIAETVARHGGILGGITFLGEAPGPRLELALDRLFAMAIAHGLDLDLHVDESCSPDARSLERIAVAALRHRFKGRIVAGHCCSLTLTPDEERARIIDRVGEANIAVVSLPMCNMYLQDRSAGRTPRLRGVAPLHELDAAGVAVMVASDNTRDHGACRSRDHRARPDGRSGLDPGAHAARACMPPAIRPHGHRFRPRHRYQPSRLSRSRSDPRTVPDDVMPADDIERLKRRTPACRSTRSFRAYAPVMVAWRSCAAWHGN